ncbi:MAG: hypothetical protein GY771_15170 [bacterium]|nr:hypothetical protein [bacterium]
MRVKTTRKGGLIKAVIVIAVLATIPVGAARYYTLYVTNATPYYIDLRLDDYYQSYVPPGETAALESAGSRDMYKMTAYAYYSPGQGVSGYASKTFDAPFPVPWSEGTDCAGRKVYYGETGACGKPVLESYPGSSDSGEWVITEAEMAGYGETPDD